MTRREFIKIAMENFGLTKEEAIEKADMRKIVEKENKEEGREDYKYTYDDLFDDEFGENRLWQKVDDDCERWLYDIGYYD